MKYRVLNNGVLEFFDATANTVGSIGANGANMKITANTGVIELGNIPSDIQVGTAGTLTNWTFLGGGSIGAGGIGTISMGQSGDTVNMNVAGVTYQYPSSFLRFNEISGANNKINITTQVPGSVILSLPNRPVVGQLTLTDNVPTSSNTAGTLTVAGGVGISGNVYAGTLNANTGFQLGSTADGTTPIQGTVKWSGSGVSPGWFGIYDIAGGKYYGIATALPATISAIGGYYQGMGVSGTTSSAGSPIFGVLSNSQSGNGLGNTSLTIYGDAKVVTLRNTLDDNRGNANVTGNLTVGNTSAVYSSTSNTTGSLIVTGGMGITGNLFMSAANNFVPTTGSASYRLGWTDNYFSRNPQFSGMDFTGGYFNTNNQLITTGALSIRNIVNNDSGNNTIIFSGQSGLLVQNGAASISNTTGALRVAGGLGVSGNVNVSNTLSIRTESGGNVPFVMQPGVIGVFGARFGVAGEILDLHTSGSPLYFSTNGARVATQFVISHTASAVNWLQATGNTTGGGVVISGQGSDTNVGINITPKGAGSANITSTANSTSNTSGALVVTGGMGITGNLFMSAANNYTTSTSQSSYRLGWTDNYFMRSLLFNGMLFQGNYLTLDAPVYLESTRVLYVRGSIAGNDTSNNTVIFTSSSPVRLQNTATSTSNTTGSLIVGGGIGVSGSIFSNSFITSTDNTNYVARIDGFGASGPRLQLGTPSDAGQYLQIGAYNNVNNFETTNRNFRLGSTTVTNIMLANATTGVVTFANSVIISGNLTVVGNVSSENVQSLSVADPLIKLGIGNYTSDLRDIGFAAHYNDGTNAHTGLIRDSGTKEYYLFQGYTPELDSNNNVIITDASFRTANLNASFVKGNLIATTAVVGGIELSSYSQAAYAQANVTIGVDTTQNTRLTVSEGVDLSQNVRLDYSNTAITIAQGVDNSQNVRLDFSNTRMTIIDGVDAGQNSRMIIIEGTDTSQNARMAIIESTNASQNVRIDYSNTALTIAQGVDNSQNVRIDFSNTAITIIQGVDTTQNTNIAATDGKMSSAYNTANNAVANIGPVITTNSVATVIIANTTSSTSNTTGALVVSGGMGVAGNIFVGGTSAGSNGVYTDILRYSANGQPWSFGGGGSIAITNDTTNSTTLFPLLSTANSGTLSTANTSNTKLFYVPSTGTLNATIFNSLSDVEYKENIITITNAVDTVNQIDGVSFSWKDNGLKSYGVIAQELEKILPELVSTAEGTKSVNYSGIIAFLINSVKELDARVKQLENK